MDSRTTTVWPGVHLVAGGHLDRGDGPLEGRGDDGRLGVARHPPCLGARNEAACAAHRFADRRDAGRRLAEPVAALGLDRPLVIALPRGGVPVAAEVAPVLDAPLDVLVVRKLGVPDQPELALGAMAEGGAEVIDRRLARLRRVTPRGARRPAGRGAGRDRAPGPRPTAAARRRPTRRDARS